MPERTPKQIYASQKRSLASIQKKLMALASQWEDVDNFTKWDLQDIADRVEAVSTQIQEFVK